MRSRPALAAIFPEVLVDGVLEHGSCYYGDATDPLLALADDNDARPRPPDRRFATQVR